VATGGNDMAEIRNARPHWNRCLRSATRGRFPSLGRGADQVDVRVVWFRGGSRSAPTRPGGRGKMRSGRESQIHLRHQDRQEVLAQAALTAFCAKNAVAMPWVAALGQGGLYPSGDTNQD